MRFLVDESTGPAVAHWLSNFGQDAVSVYDHYPGMDDEELLRCAVSENRILITDDRSTRAGYVDNCLADLQIGLEEIMLSCPSEPSGSHPRRMRSSVTPEN